MSSSSTGSELMQLSKVMGWFRPSGGCTSEVVGGTVFGLGTCVHTLWAIGGRDVAEPALLGAGNADRRLWRRDAADEAAEVLDEALVDAALGNAVGVVVVNDLAGELGIPVLLHGLGQGVHVDHDLVMVPGLFLAALDVNDEDAVVVEHQQVGLAGEGGGLTAESESVLVLEAYVVAAVGPLVSLLVEQGGMPREPVGLVEVGRFTVPALVMG